MRCLFALVAAVLVSGCQRDPCEDDFAALYYSQRLIEPLLRSPGTAEFPGRRDRGVIVNQEGECRFRVAGYVDSQNGFGGTVRTRYVMDLEYDRRSERWSQTGLLTD